MTDTTLASLETRFALPREEGTSKVMPLRDAVRAFVQPGATIHVGYSDARPNAALMELVRVFGGSAPGFTLVTAGLVNLQHALIELGLVKKVVASFAGENYPVARPNPALVRAIRDGRVQIENWSLWTLIARLVAGALGVPSFPVRSLRDSTMGEEAQARGEYVPHADGTGTVSALRPDVVLLHGAVADAFGNVVLSGPFGESAWGSFAATGGVIATVERIVSTEEIRELNTLTRIPGHLVRAVSEVPMGAHPFGFNGPGVPGVTPYTEDAAFVAEVLTASRTPETFRAWIDEHILGTADHSEVLSRLGEERLEQLRSRARPGAWRSSAVPGWLPPDPASPTEDQVIVTARRLMHRTREVGHHAVLAGVGLSNLAAWVGCEQLRAEGIGIELMAEIGLFGYAPRPGSPFIFAGQNIPTNKMLTDVMGVLGTLVSGPATRSIGVIGAGQIDSHGAVNSTYSDAGDFIVGSGGANDVLSAADEVIITVAHQPTRLVEQVAYVTCPGDRVSTIVTDLAVFERRGDGFVLTALLPAAGDDDATAVEKVRSRTGWEVAVAADLVREPPASAEELALLRVFDPDRLFLRDRPKQ